MAVDGARDTAEEPRLAGRARLPGVGPELKKATVGGAGAAGPSEGARAVGPARAPLVAYVVVNGQAVEGPVGLGRRPPRPIHRVDAAQAPRRVEVVARRHGHVPVQVAATAVAAQGAAHPAAREGREVHRDGQGPVAHAVAAGPRPHRVSVVASEVAVARRAEILAPRRAGRRVLAARVEDGVRQVVEVAEVLVRAALRVLLPILPRHPDPPKGHHEGARRAP